jgi:hypothetical protein
MKIKAAETRHITTRMSKNRHNSRVFRNLPINPAIRLPTAVYPMVIRKEALVFLSP